MEEDTLSYIIVQQPSHGALSGTAPDLTYTPAANYHGPDSFTFKANDGTDDSNVATVSITVNPVNDPPLAVSDAYSVKQDNILTVPAPGVLGNDGDVDGDNLSAVLASNPSHGAVGSQAIAAAARAGVVGGDAIAWPHTPRSGSRAQRGRALLLTPSARSRA